MGSERYRRSGKGVGHGGVPEAGYRCAPRRIEPASSCGFLRFGEFQQVVNRTDQAPLIRS